MSAEMQLGIVLSVLAVAVVYVAWRAARVLGRRQAGGCGSGCGTCPANEADGTAAKPIIRLGTERLTRKRSLPG